MTRQLQVFFFPLHIFFSKLKFIYILEKNMPYGQFLGPPFVGGGHKIVYFLGILILVCVCVCSVCVCVCGVCVCGVCVCVCSYFIWFISFSQFISFIVLINLHNREMF